jgi:hypothetical protein
MSCSDGAQQALEPFSRALRLPASRCGLVFFGRLAGGEMRGPVRSEPRDISPHESGAVDASRRRPLLVHADDGKQVFRPDGPVDRRVVVHGDLGIGDV